MKKNKKNKLLCEIIVPKEVEIVLNDLIDIKGPKGEVRRKLGTPGIIIEKKGDDILISSKKSTKREKKLMCSIKSHIKNMIEGVQNPFVYKMQICSVHFPMTVTIDKPNNLLKIKNFFGETKERTARIVEGSNVKIDGDKIEVESCDIEKAGQTVANIESSTKVKNKDRRIFQDGIFIVSKAGEDI